MAPEDRSGFRFPLNTFSFFYVLALALLPIAWIPSLDTDLLKGIFAAGAMAFAALIAGIVLLVSSKYAVRIPRSPVLAFAASFLLIGCVSAFLVGGGRVALWGAGFEMTTVGSLVLFALAVVGGLSFPRSPIFFLHVVMGATALALFSSAALSLWNPELLAGSTVAGVWPHLSSLIGLSLLCSVLLCGQSTGGVRVAYALLAIVYLAGLALFFYPPVAYIAACVLLLVALYTFVFRIDNRSAWAFATSTGAAVAIIALSFAGARAQPLELPSELRPSFFATQLIAVSSMSEGFSNALVGSGPNSLSQAWEQHRPFSFNAGSLWNTPVQSSYSAATDILITLGALGLATFILGVLFMLALAVVKMHSPHGAASFTARRDTLQVLFFAAIYVMGVVLFAPRDVSIFLIGGVIFGSAARLIAAGEYRAAGSSWLVRLCGGAIVVAITISVFSIASHQFSAHVYHARGVRAFNAGDMSAGSDLLEKAAQAWGIPAYQQDAALGMIEEAFAKFRLTEGAGDPDVASLHARAISAFDLARAATEVSPRDAERWMFLASLYVRLVPYGFPDVETSALAAISQARQHAPMRPEPLYLHAILAAGLGRLEEAKSHLREALRLKQDYKDAVDLLSTLENPPPKSGI